MSNATSISDQAASLRNLKRLVVILIASNIALGVFSVYLLRTVDRRYTELLDRSVPVLNDLQTLTAESVSAMRGTGPALFAATEKNRAALLQSAQAALKEDREFRNRLVRGDWLSSKPKGKLNFQQAGEAFTKDSLEVLRLLEAGNAEEASRLRDNVVRPEFDHYLDAITKVADDLEAESLQTNSDYTARTNSLTTVVLGVAGWPLLVFGVLLVLVAVLVVAMMIAFRGKDLADAP